MKKNSNFMTNKSCASSDAPAKEQALYNVVVYWDPSQVFGGDASELNLTKEDIIKHCFRVRSYTDYAMALMSYASTFCTWSRILMPDEESPESFIKKAYQHIVDDDFAWLEKFFV